VPDADAGPGYYAYLTYNVPLSSMRAHRLVAADPRTVLDAGCGWGELLLQVLACVPAASGVGVDTDPRALARGRANADSLGLTDRVRFVEAAAAEATQEPADVVICLGSSQAFGSSADALHALYPLLRPGGRLLFGDAIWERPPTAELIEQLAGLGTVTDLAGVVDIAIDAGFRPLSGRSSSPATWRTGRNGCSETPNILTPGTSEPPPTRTATSGSADIVLVSPAILGRAARFIGSHGLCGYAAVQLSCARTVAGVVPECRTFGCYDRLFPAELDRTAAGY